MLTQLFVFGGAMSWITTAVGLMTLGVAAILFLLAMARSRPGLAVIAGVVGFAPWLVGLLGLAFDAAYVAAAIAPAVPEMQGALATQGFAEALSPRVIGAFATGLIELLLTAGLVAFALHGRSRRLAALALSTGTVAVLGFIAAWRTLSAVETLQAIAASAPTKALYILAGTVDLYQAAQLSLIVLLVGSLGAAALSARDLAPRPTSPPAAERRLKLATLVVIATPTLVALADHKLVLGSAKGISRHLTLPSFISRSDLPRALGSAYASRADVELRLETVKIGESTWLPTDLAKPDPASALRQQLEARIGSGEAPLTIAAGAQVTGPTLLALLGLAQAEGARDVAFIAQAPLGEHLASPSQPELLPAFRALAMGAHQLSVGLRVAPAAAPVLRLDSHPLEIPTVAAGGVVTLALSAETRVEQVVQALVMLGNRDLHAVIAVEPPEGSAVPNDEPPTLADPPPGLGLHGKPAEKLVGSGALPMEAIKAVIDAHKGEIRRCYEQALVQEPQLEGKVTVTWMIAETGKVARVSVKESSLNSPAVERCITQAVSRWVFPEPYGRGVVEVNYPFVFKTS